MLQLCMFCPSALQHTLATSLHAACAHKQTHAQPLAVLLAPSIPAIHTLRNSHDQDMKSSARSARCIARVKHSSLPEILDPLYTNTNVRIHTHTCEPRPKCIKQPPVELYVATAE